MNNLNNSTKEIIIGIDEVGRGCIAGPVVAAAVAVDKTWQLAGLTDSKKITKTKRQQLAKMIQQQCHIAIGQASACEIDEINILQATKLAMRRAYDELAVTAHCYIDGNMNFPNWPTTYDSIIKGDEKVMAISAASVVAKVYRDQLMMLIGQQFNYYNWQKNSGYPTKQHLKTINEYGLSSHHRVSFKPVKEYLAQNHKLNLVEA